ncbi:uncharacterized protein LOC119650933 isoform X2 [Hermetia illucens]|uniref:uncharacterized protein LOC119650933 isoform X2 n=1 Tax=Hermetia illucens TaxID=343691 RepID=UPI0018CC53EE|nr:uncharacterized protein LOC119650933 isoform X2 [Hermetia illucens]
MYVLRISISVLLICATFNVGAQVSTKLDLNDDSKEGTSPKSTPRPNTSSGSNSKISPKIEGVRVTVDTSDGKKTKEAESKESVEIVDNKSTKRVGIHTDITFEITDDKNDFNATSSEQGEKDNDASVPIFKGRTSTRRPQSRLPYNPRIHTNYPGQIDYIPNDRDRYNGHGVPAFPGSNDEVWTTERTSYFVPARSHYQPQDVNYRSYNHETPNYRPVTRQPHYSQSQQQLGHSHGWQPCVCVYDNQWKDSNSIRSFRSTAGRKLKPTARHSSELVSSKIEK